jgi:NAD(P)-dependent dehydrogenase (short-subunit alcohol dehydrogenase family)
MANVCVITDGGSGIGLETARNIPKDVILVLTGRTVSKLENAGALLEAEGHEVHLTACDVSVRRDVHELCLFASSFGTIKTVIHAAGLSPTMGDPEKIIMVNAIGTKNVNMEFYKYMNDGGVIVDIASSSAYEAPSFLVKHQIFEMAEFQEEKFLKHMVGESKMAPGDANDAGFAYTLSKRFVVWYAAKCAHEYAKKGIRVVSVSPGLIETDMGTREAEAWDYTKEMVENTCEQRMGTAAEMGFSIAMIADERNGYLRGIDVLIDGGASTGKQIKNK